MNQAVVRSSYQPAFSSRRGLLFTSAVLLMFSLLLMRAYSLQVMQGEAYAAKSEENFIQERRIPHARGLIFDQAGRVLVDNRPAYDVTVTAAFLPDSARSLRQALAPLDLGGPALVDIDRSLLAHIDSSDPVVAATDQELDLCQEVQANALRFDIRGIDIRINTDDRCDVLLSPQQFPSRAALFARVGALVGLPKEDMQPRVEATLRRSAGLARFKPQVLLEDVGYSAFVRLEAAAALRELPGIHVVDSQRRRYRNETRAAHVLGYLNEVSPDELKDQEARPDNRTPYVLGDRVGRRGVEGSYESVLRGVDGSEQLVVDAKGRPQDQWAQSLLGDDRVQEPSPGRSLVLSLDDDMQATAESAFGGLAGSVVAIEVATGFVLAMASFPGYDPNLIAGPWSKELIRELLADKNKPFINKAIQDHYAPGSTFKAITASAGLRNQLITEHSTRACPGSFRLGRSTWRCFNRSGHGPLSLVRALQVSCDSYFYSLGYELGPDRLAATGRLFSMGKKTGIDIGGEGAGIMPDRAYYVRRQGAYTPGLVVNNSIGQGDVAVTPLQLAVAYGALANGGKVLQPQLVRAIVDGDGKVLEEHQPVVMGDLGLSSTDLDLMKEALSHVTDPGGTASGLYWRNDRYAEMSKWLRDSGITIVGKTGTAQVVKLSKSVQHVDAKDVPYEQRDHAWFVGAAPLDQPEIVVVAMTEHGGFGGSTSGPVVAEIMRTWFTRVRGKGRFESLPPLPPPKSAVVRRAAAADPDPDIVRPQPAAEDGDDTGVDAAVVP
jgi:penicillin-binding protein 2